jgi:hypothetical protein
MHRNPADRDRHAEAGFDTGWAKAAKQLETLAMTLMEQER